MNTALIYHEKIGYVSFGQSSALAGDAGYFNFADGSIKHMLFEAIEKGDEATIIGMIAACGRGFVVEGLDNNEN